MPAPVERHHVLCEEFPQHGDLLLNAPAPRAKVLIERGKLRLNPPYANPEAETPSGEHIYLSCLFGDKHRLALGQRQHAGDELDAPRHAGEIAEEDEGFMDVSQCVGADPHGAVREVCSRDMLPGLQVRVAQILCRLRIVANCAGIGTDPNQRKVHTDTHSQHSRRFTAAHYTTGAAWYLPAGATCSPW
jgi:hypothetical protein